MFEWFLKKWGGASSSSIDSPLQKSFSNIKADMAQISQWILHFKERHDLAEQKIHEHAKKHVEHGNKLEETMARLALVEQQLLSLGVQNISNSNRQIKVSEGSVPFLSTDESILPSSQQRVCFILANLQQRDSDKWFPLSQIAGEMYPGRDYKDTRSAILQLVNVLEVEGYLLKKKVNRVVYVLLRKEKISEFIKDSSSIKNKAKQKK